MRVLPRADLLTADPLAALHAVPAGYTLVNGGVPVWDPDLPHAREWPTLGDVRVGSRFARLRQAGAYRVLEYGDGYRAWLAIMVPDDRLDAYMRQIVGERRITPEAARAWLLEHRGEMGTEIYEWAARGR